MAAAPKRGSPEPDLPSLPLRELEPLAGRGLPVFLPLFHASVAGEESFFAQQSPKGWIDSEQRPRRAEADRSGLPGQTAAPDAGDEIELVGGVARDERLQRDPTQREA